MKQTEFLNKAKQKISCFFGFHTMKDARFHMGSYANRKGGITTVIIQGQECVHCGYQQPLDDFVHNSEYSNHNDYVR